MHTTIWVVWVVAANLSYEIYSAVTVLLQNVQKTACSRPCCVLKLATKQSEEIIAKIKLYVILSFSVCVQLIWFYGLICEGFAGMDSCKVTRTLARRFWAWGVQPAKHPGHEQKKAKSGGVAVFIHRCSVHLCTCCIDAQCCEVYSKQHSLTKLTAVSSGLNGPWRFAESEKKYKYLKPQFKSPRKSNWTIYFGKLQ